MITKLFLIIVFNFSLADDGVILNIENNEYTMHQFYARYPKKQWERADSTQKNKMYSDFLHRELCILESKNLGYTKDPEIAIKIKDRSKQLLVNESYEHFVALPLIDSTDIKMAKKYALNEIFVSHILIGYENAYLAKPPSRTIDEANEIAFSIKKEYINGTSFSVLAEKYSDDPGVYSNSGSLGWVSWGMTVPEFQLEAFSQEIGILSDPVLSAFGYHLILVTDKRASDYQYMTNKEYESAIINLSKGRIRDRLRPAAIKYDSLQIKKHNVVFNEDALKIISQEYNKKQKEGSLSGAAGLSSKKVLNDISNKIVVCVYNNKGLGAKWFANKLKKVPNNRQPDLSLVENILSVFKTVLLQDIAIKKAIKHGVNNNFTFLMRKNDIVSSLLYDHYLKNVINDIKKPDSIKVKQYYNKHKNEKYSYPEKVSVKEIRVSSRSLADSIRALLINGESFSLLAEKFSLINANKGGVMAPFDRKKNNSFFDAVMAINVGDITKVMPAPNNRFSILKLDKKIPSEPKKLSLVYNRIEAFLYKEYQNKKKLSTFKYLSKKYNIKKNTSFFN